MCRAGMHILAWVLDTAPVEVVACKVPLRLQMAPVEVVACKVPLRLQMAPFEVGAV